MWYCTAVIFIGLVWYCTCDDYRYYVHVFVEENSLSALEKSFHPFKANDLATKRRPPPFFLLLGKI